MLSYSLPKTQRTHRNIITLAEMLSPIHYSAWLRVGMRAQWGMRMRNLQVLEMGISEWSELRQTELGWGCLWSSNTRMKLTTVYTRYIYSIYSVYVCVCVYIYIYMCVCVYIYMYIYMCVCVYIYIYIYMYIYIYIYSSKESACQYRRFRRHSFDLWVGKIPWSRKWQPTPVFLPGKSHEQRSLADYSPRGCKELDTSERLNTQYVSYVLDKKIIHRNEKHYWQGHVDLWQLDKDTRKRVTGLLSALSSLGSGYNRFGGFPGGSDGKKSACNVGDWGLIRS